MSSPNRQDKTTIIPVLLAWLFALQLLAAPVSAQQANQATAPVQVIFLRGIFNVFSTGLDDMARQIEQQGIRASVFAHGDWQQALSKIVADRAVTPNLRGIIVGHSLGANAAVVLANALDARNIRIELLLTLDPTVSRPIPDNVINAVNYILPQSLWGEVLARKTASAGPLQNIKLSTTLDFGHFSMTEDRQLMQMTILRILQAAGHRVNLPPPHRNTMR